MTCPGSPTGSAKFPVAAYSVTQWTHGDVVPWMTNLHARINRKAHAELYFFFILSLFRLCKIHDYNPPLLC